MKKKILVVDDEKAIHAILRMSLQPDYEVLSALDGIQGVAMAKQVKPDLVILDLQMPAGGGKSVYERLRMLSDTLAIPILVLSVSTPAEVLAKIPEIAEDCVLTKPAALQTIRDSVDKVLGA